MRLPRPAEHELIGDWQAAFAEEVNLADEAARQRDNAARRIAAGDSRVWDDGAMVAYASSSSDAETARIGPVYTPPGFRGRGYASALVACLARELFGRDKRAIFITTDVANPVSNRIYARIGFRPVADHFGFDFVSAAS
jgi:predicted GNAT family acetyltransferase